MLRKIFATSLFSAISIWSMAQSNPAVHPFTAEEDPMRQNGKILVVMAVCITILIGLILYLVRLDRKITKLEKSS